MVVCLFYNCRNGKWEWLYPLVARSNRAVHCLEFATQLYGNTSYTPYHHNKAMGADLLATFMELEWHRGSGHILYSTSDCLSPSTRPVYYQQNLISDHQFTFLSLSGNVFQPHRVGREKSKLYDLQVSYADVVAVKEPLPLYPVHYIYKNLLLRIPLLCICFIVGFPPSKGEGEGGGG